jgi:predicted anti-sigma-YlaC factor YlaD
MRCLDCRSALSARLDGEDPAQPASVVDAHLAGCEGCRQFASGVASLHRAVRLTPAEPIADLTPDILHAIGRDSDTRERSSGLRMCLALVGLLQLAVAIPALVLGDDAGLPVHTAHHIGSFTAALAVGFLFVAWRPERAAGLLPVAAALVAFVLGTTVLDVATGRTAAFSETGHVPEVVGLAIPWLLARPDPSGRATPPEVARA